MPNSIKISPPYRDLLASLLLDTPESIFSDARLRVWRNLEDRDNSTLDATRPDGTPVRLHIKRDKHKRREPMALEARGIGLLNTAGIESAPLVAHGEMSDGRTFVITENLDGYLSADRLIESLNHDASMEKWFRAWNAITDAMLVTAAALHRGGLHHRDLYANHFYLRPREDAYDVRLIDTARVKAIPSWFGERWIVKDVAQLVFSLLPYMKNPTAPDDLLSRYCAAAGRKPEGWFARRVEAKWKWIDRHDRALRAKKPTRNLRLADGN